MEKQTHKVMKCNLCKHEGIQTSTLGPTGFWICNQCGARTSEQPFEMIVTHFGFTFKEVPKKKIVKKVWV